jgi:transposase
VDKKQLDEEISTIEAKIQTDIDNDDGLKQKVARLLTVKNIGNAMIPISILPELGKVSNKQIAALVGVAPYSKDSEWQCLTRMRQILLDF